MDSTDSKTDPKQKKKRKRRGSQYSEDSSVLSVSESEQSDTQSTSTHESSESRRRNRESLQIYPNNRSVRIKEEHNEVFEHKPRRRRTAKPRPESPVSKPPSILKKNESRKRHSVEFQDKKLEENVVNIAEVEGKPDLLDTSVDQKPIQQPTSSRFKEKDSKDRIWDGNKELIARSSASQSTIETEPSSSSFVPLKGVTEITSKTKHGASQVRIKDDEAEVIKHVNKAPTDSSVDRKPSVLLTRLQALDIKKNADPQNIGSIRKRNSPIQIKEDEARDSGSVSTASANSSVSSRSSVQSSKFKEKESTSTINISSSSQSFPNDLVEKTKLSKKPIQRPKDGVSRPSTASIISTLNSQYSSNSQTSSNKSDSKVSSSSSSIVDLVDNRSEIKPTEPKRRRMNQPDRKSKPKNQNQALNFGILQLIFRKVYQKYPLTKLIVCKN